jgi:hypothetical protein
MGAYAPYAAAVGTGSVGNVFGQGSARECVTRGAYSTVRTHDTECPILRSTDGVRSVSGRDLYDAGVGNASFRSADRHHVYDGGV